MEIFRAFGIAIILLILIGLGSQWAREKHIEACIKAKQAQLDLKECK